MLAFVYVTAALLPIAPYLVAAPFGYGAAGAAVGLTWAIMAALRRHGRRPPAVEVALVVGLAAALVTHLLPAAISLPHGEALIMAALAVGAAVSLTRGRPWTGAYAARAHGGAAGTPLFGSVNRVTSAIWAVLFGWLAVSSLLDLALLARYLPLAGGAVASIAFPPVLMRRGLERMARGDLHPSWRAPDFAAAPIPVPASVDAANAVLSSASGETRAPTGDRRTHDEAVDVAIVGAGIGGLTAAALLADAGLRVAVFEQHSVAGGFAHHWTRSARDPATGERVAFRFDAGVHDVSGWHRGGTVRRLFERLGIADDDWRRLDHRYLLDGHTIDVPRDWRAYVRLLGDAYPHAADGIRALFDDIHAVYTGMFSTADERGGIPGTPSTPERVLAFAHAHPLAAAWLDRPWPAFVARHVRDARVNLVLHALAGYLTDDPARLLVREMVPIFGYSFEGGHYPLGGSGRMTDRLVEAIEARGGRVHLRHAVERVHVDGDAVRAVTVRPARCEPRRVTATAAVWNADARALGPALAGDGPAALELARATRAWTPSCSAVGVNLGLRGALGLPPVIHVQADDGFAALVAPSVVDPSCAPAGYATLAILELLGADEAQAWFADGRTPDPHHRARRAQPAYQARKRALADRLVARARLAIPDLDQRIVTRHDASPVTYARYAWTTDGAIYGVRGRGRPQPGTTGVHGLVLAGAATHGPGIEAVVISGAFAAEALRPGVLAANATHTPRPLRRVA